MTGQFPDAAGRRVALKDAGVGAEVIGCLISEHVADSELGPSGPEVVVAGDHRDALGVVVLEDRVGRAQGVPGLSSAELTKPSLPEAASTVEIGAVGDSSWLWKVNVPPSEPGKQQHNIGNARGLSVSATMRDRR